MATNPSKRQDPQANRPVIEWLLDSDPSIRWQVLQDLTGASADEVTAERARVAAEGAGARLLSLQASDGRWGGAAWNHGWNSTMHVLTLLRELGLDPASHQARQAPERQLQRAQGLAKTRPSRNLRCQCADWLCAEHVRHVASVEQRDAVFKAQVQCRGQSGQGGRPIEPGLPHLHLGEAVAPAAPHRVGEQRGDILGQPERLADVADGAARPVVDHGGDDGGYEAAHQFHQPGAY